jgi:signal transduction histidine kinase
VPLAGGKVGVLSVADPLGRREFGASDVDALQEFAAYIALAVDRAGLRQEIIRAQEDERQRVAQDLHDGVGHALVAAIFRLDLHALQLADDQDEARRAIEVARAAIEESTGILRETAYALRPRILTDLGLAAALRSLVTRAEQSGLRVLLTIEGELGRLDTERELAVFRVAQEALTNVLKHARATRVLVQLALGAGALLLAIEDDGVGLPAGTAPPPGRGLGLPGMRERVEAFGGAFTIGPAAGSGTRLLTVLPLAQD